MKKILKNLKYLKLKDLLAIFIFIFTFPIALMYKLILKIRKKEIWLICEDKEEARDNGYHLFKYIREKYPEINVYYAIDKKSCDYTKVKKYGNIIQYESLKHWIYYLTASKNISTQKCGNPNAPLFYFLQVYGILKNNRIFLQHGITKDNAKWLYYNETKFRLFICGAKPEYEYIKEKFGYPNENLKYLGFPRFDELHNIKINKKQILLMPTWRNWLSRETNFIDTNKEKFEDTLYFKTYNSLINNNELIEFLKEKDITLCFYPHRNMQKFIKLFNTTSNNIKILDKNDIDIQTLLKESALMITDYSSVYFDFAYMKKPLIYYHFDYEEYRQKQLQVGYFDYNNDGFGSIINNEQDLIKKIKEYVENDYKIENEYLIKINNFFELNDKENCKRNFEVIKSI